MLKPVRHKEPDLLDLSSQSRQFNNNQHGKRLFTSTTTTKQTKNHKPNQKQTLKNNQKKGVCTQDKPTTTKRKSIFHSLAGHHCG